MNKNVLYCQYLPRGNILLSCMFLWVTVVPLCRPVVLQIISTKHYHQMLKQPLLYHGSVDDVGWVKDPWCPLLFSQGAADDGLTILLRCWLLHPQEDVSIPSERRASLQCLLHQAPCHHTRYSRIQTNTQKTGGKHTDPVFFLPFRQILRMEMKEKTWILKV